MKTDERIDLQRRIMNLKAPFGMDSGFMLGYKHALIDVCNLLRGLSEQGETTYRTPNGHNFDWETDSNGVHHLVEKSDGTR